MKRAFIFFLFIFGLSLFLSPALAQETKVLDRVVVDATTPLKGPIVKAGETIILKGEINGDVMLFGGEVLVDAVINGDLIVVGGQVEIKGNILNDLRVVAGQVTIDATIGDDVSLAGGQIDISDDSQLGNSLLAVAGMVSVNSRVNDIVYLIAGRVRFAGQAGGDVTIKADTIDVNQSANVAGNLKLIYREPPLISDQAVVSGDLIQEKTSAPSSSDKFSFKKVSLVKKVTTLYIVQQLAGLLLDIIIASLFILFVPKLVKSVIKAGLDHSSQAVGWGLVKLFILPIIGILFIITLIGIPLGVLTFVLYAFSLYIAKLVAYLFVGAKLLKDEKLAKPIKSLIIGGLVVSLIKIIPLAGWLAYFFLILLGLGSMSLVEKAAWKKYRK